MSNGKKRSNFFTDFGHLSRLDLLKLMKSVDVIFLPSRIEGFSYTIAESLSLGTPILAREDWGGFKHHYHQLFQEFNSYDSPEFLLDSLLELAKRKKEKPVGVPKHINILNISKIYLKLYYNI